jgi:hypothetical protein
MVGAGLTKARISTFWSDQPEHSIPRGYEVSLEWIESIEPLNAMSALDKKQ